MKAKEMFEELGYKVFDTSFIIVYYINMCPEGVDNLLECLIVRIIFDISKKDIRVEKNIMTENYPMILSIEDHKAIHQQMIELGWL